MAKSGYSCSRYSTVATDNSARAGPTICRSQRPCPRCYPCSYSYSYEKWEISTLWRFWVFSGTGQDRVGSAIGGSSIGNQRQIGLVNASPSVDIGPWRPEAGHAVTHHRQSTINNQYQYPKLRPVGWRLEFWVRVFGWLAGSTTSSTMRW